MVMPLQGIYNTDELIKGITILLASLMGASGMHLFFMVHFNIKFIVFIKSPIKNL